MEEKNIKDEYQRIDLDDNTFLEQNFAEVRDNLGYGYGDDFNNPDGEPLSEEDILKIKQELVNLYNETNNTDNTTLKIKFNENLSDNSIKMIKDILSGSLGFKTTITEI